MKIGALIGEKFRIERILGEGGMGVVALATHVHLHERVALKFMRREMMGVPDVIARFTQEARAAAKLKGAHVARVFDVGTTHDGVPYLVMEYLEGRDLRVVLSEQGPPLPRDTARYVIEACNGLAEAHAQGIVHRDVKPDNLFLALMPDGSSSIKVLDFGISKLALRESPYEPYGVPSNTVVTMGSPQYMSPEQLRSTGDVTHQTDIWSLGVVLFELLSGRLPFDSALQFAELAAHILRDPPPRLSKLVSDVPLGLESIVLRCMAPACTERYGSVADLSRALLPYATPQVRPLVERTVSLCAAAGLCSESEAQPVRRPQAAGADVLHRLAAELTVIVGPFAKIHVERELRAMGTNAASVTLLEIEDLALRLATKIPEAPERRAFLNAASVLWNKRLS